MTTDNNFSHCRWHGASQLVMVQLLSCRPHDSKLYAVLSASNHVRCSLFAAKACRWSCDVNSHRLLVLLS